MAYIKFTLKNFDKSNSRAETLEPGALKCRRLLACQQADQKNEGGNKGEYNQLHIVHAPPDCIERKFKKTSERAVSGFDRKVIILRF